MRSQKVPRVGRLLADGRRDHRWRSRGAGGPPERGAGVEAVRSQAACGTVGHMSPKEGRAQPERCPSWHLHGIAGFQNTRNVMIGVVLSKSRVAVLRVLGGDAI